MPEENQNHWVDRFDKHLESLSTKIDNLANGTHIRLDAHNDRVDAKIASLDAKMEEQHRQLSETIQTKFSDLNDRIYDNAAKLSKHEHNFSVLNFLVTSGIATLLAIVSFISGFLPWGSKH